MPTNTQTGKTGAGSASLGATRSVIDVECRITSLTNPKVRQGPSIGGTTRVQYAGSYGLIFTGSGNALIVRQYVLHYTKQDIAEPALIGATDVFWDLPTGVTVTIITTYS